MRVVIHQAYFIPWLGYFSKLGFADAFVVLDDVDFRKRHYFDRTKIINMHGEPDWIGLPVGLNHHRRCSDVHLHNRACVRNLLMTIQQSYAHALHRDDEIDELLAALEAPLSELYGLIDINLRIITNITHLVGLKAPTVFFASQLRTEHERTAGLIEICNRIGASSLIIGTGKSLQMHDWTRVKASGIRLFVQDYFNNHPVYLQSRRRYRGFAKGLSIIDAILNVGRDKTREFLADAKHSPKEIEKVHYA